MTTEQLRMLVEMIGAMTDAGKQAFIWWLVADKFFPAIIFLICFVLVYVAIRRFIKAIAIDNEACRLANELSLEKWRQEQKEKENGKT